jgi:hypothetical protein
LDHSPADVGELCAQVALLFLRIDVAEARVRENARRVPVEQRAYLEEPLRDQ